MSRASVGALARRVMGSRAARVLFVLLAVVLGGLAVADQWEDVRESLARLGVATLAGSLVLAVAGLIAAMLVWRSLLAGLGSRLPIPDAGRILFVSQLGKYIPGSVWPVLAQMELGHDQGVPRRRSATAFVLLSVVSIGSLGLVAVATLPFLPDVPRIWRWGALLVPVLLAMLHPRVLNPLLDRLLRLARRPPLERPLTWRPIVLGLVWALVSWVAYGLHAWLLAIDLGADPWEALPLAVGGYAMAWLAGYLFVIAPAGAGVREVVLVAAFAPVLPAADAIVVALVSRLLMTLADLLVAFTAVTSFRIRRRGPGTAVAGRSTPAQPGYHGGPDGDV